MNKEKRMKNLMKNCLWYISAMVSIMPAVFGNYNEDNSHTKMKSKNNQEITSEVPSGFYVGVDLGYNLVLNINSVKTIYDQAGAGVNYKGRGSFVYAFNAGYQMRNYRFEVLGSLLNSRVSFNGNTTHLRDWTVMPRGIYDFTTGVTGFFPYLGLQIGAYGVNPDNPKYFGIQAPMQSGTVFAYGPIFGVRYNLIYGLYIHGEWNSVTTLELKSNNYSFRVNTNTFLGGLKYKF